jgi:hypothetical protein
MSDVEELSEWIPVVRARQTFLRFAQGMRYLLYWMCNSEARRALERFIACSKIPEEIRIGRLARFGGAVLVWHGRRAVSARRNRRPA